MKINRIPPVIILLALTTTLALADPLGTAFTYQGRLTDSGGPATGLYDFQFVLCDAATSGAALSTNTVAAAPVTNGLYSVALDFGADAFDGSARWLALSVRTNGGSAWTALTPRLGLTPTPYAIRATTAGGVSGVIPDTQLSTNIPRLDGTNVFSGPVTAPTFSGSGAALSGVAPAFGSTNYVAKAGDTMTGTLNLPANGLVAGASQLVLSNGNIGIWSANPQRMLQIGDSDTSGLSVEGYTTSPNVGALRFGDNSGWRLNIGRSRDIPNGALNSGIQGVVMTIQDNGNVGIGTTSPQARLDIPNGSVKVDISPMIIANGAVSGDAYPLGLSTTYHGQGGTGWTPNGAYGTVFTVKQFETRMFQFDVDPDDPANGTYLRSFYSPNWSPFRKIHVEGDAGVPGNAIFAGNVGIGTTSPQLTLHVVGSIMAEGTGGGGQIVLQSTAVGGHRYEWYPDQTGVGDLALYDRTGGADPLVIKSSGNVGIGTTTPSAKLEVAGNLKVSGTGNSITTPVLSITGGSDVAEPFPLATQEIPKGAVVVIDEEHPGQLKLSTEPYDQRVAGIVSGANGINPGITLSQQGVLEGGQNVALSGRVYVLADAANAPIKPGDLLTTSAIPGHAMKVADHAKAQGAILGKAMSCLPEGRGLVLVLVTLQ